jgi:HEAT repeat protein
MPTLSHRKSLLTLLLLALLLEFITPVLIQADDPYERVEQTDADFKPERIHELLGVLKDSNEELREAAIEAIRILGPEARAASPLLIRQLENVEERFLPFWHWSIESDALVDLGAEAVTHLVKLFPLSSPKAKRMIAKIAVEMGTDARELLPLLSQEYRTADKEIRPEYLIAIASIDPTGDTAFPLILNALRTADSESERAQAAVCLENPETVGHRWIESKAEQWYQRGSQDPDKAVDALLQALKDKEPMVRGAAIEALESYRKHGDRIVPELITLLDDDGEYSVWISSDFGIPAYVCDTAIFVLGSFPDHSEQSVPEIVKKMLRDERWLYVPPFEEIYAELIPHTAEPLEHLRKLLGSKFPDQTLLTIARMGQTAQPLIVKVAKLAESEDPKIALKARITLACIDERWQGEANELI